MERQGGQSNNETKLESAHESARKGTGSYTSDLVNSPSQ